MMNNYNLTSNRTGKLAKYALFCLVLVMGLGNSLRAQLAMTRSIFNGAYTPITVGGGATAVAGAVGDDVAATALPIGFTFNYLGTGYTTFTGCSNGWISFTATGSNAANTSMYGTAAPNATIAPWFDDLATTEFLYQTTGTPGSQTCVIQWTSSSYWNNAGRVLRYQVKLYEGTNVIEFAYDALPTGALSTAESASIGIEGITGGNGQYLDAVTGSAFTGNGYLQSDRWPTYNFRFTPGAPTAIAGGTYNVGVGQTFINLNEAAAEINHKGITGPVVLNLTDAQYDVTPANGANFFPILFGPITGNSSVNTVTVTKIGAPAIIAYGGNNGTNGFTANQTAPTTSGTTEPIIGLVGADYFTIENLDIRGNVGNLSADYGVAIINSSATDGAQNNIVQNVTVTMNRVATSTRGFFSNVLTTPTSAAGANSNNTFRNFSITNAYAGIQLIGNATFPDENNIIGNTVCTNFNTIGNPSQANDIGNGTSESYGIKATQQSNISIYNNSIRNVTSSAAVGSGIFVDIIRGNSSVYNNKIQTIKNSSTSSTTAIVGIRASNGTTGTNNVRIYNNIISEIISSYTGAASATRTIKGIFLNSTGGGNGNQSYDVHNNSVSIDGSSSPTLSSVCFEHGGAANPIYRLSNNIFANFTVAQTGVARHSVVVSTSATAFGPAGSSSNNNNLFVANDIGTSGFIGIGNTTGFNTVADWTTAMVTPGGIEAASLSVNPNYLNNTNDLHAGNILLNNAGQALQAYVTNDLDCAARADNDMGAYNLSGCSGTPTAGSISGVNAVCSGFGTTLNLTGASNDAGVTYQWASSSTPGGPYTNAGTTNSQATGNLTTDVYYIVTVTCSVSGFSAVTAEKSVLVNTLPVVVANPGTGTYCTPGGTAVAIAASGAATYTWLPAAGLSATTGANVNASPSATTTYTVTGTDGNGCIGTATSAITVGAMPVVTSVTASPSSVCSGANSQLQANATIAFNNTAAAYSFAGSTGTYTPIGGTVLGAGVIGDDTGIGNLPIGFPFNYNGATHTVFGVSSNGLIQLSQTNATFGGLSGNALATNANSIAALWDDNNTTGATVSYLLTGTSPNQVLTVQWTGMHVGSVGSSTNPTIDVQILLHEATGQIQIIYGSTSATLVGTTASIGISGAAGNYLSVTPLSPASASTVSNTAENTTISAATNFPTGTIYTFTPLAAPTLTYAWLPATFLNDATIANPLASAITASTTYTATVTSSLGCAATGTVAITAGAALSATSNISPSNTTCVGSSVTLQSVPVGGGGPFTYAWAGPNGFTSAQQDTTLASVTLAQAGTYTVTITDNCGANTNSTVALTVNTLPTVVSTPNSGAICLPGGSAVPLTASGALTFAWAPSAGLSATTGASVSANPVATTTYTVTGTDGNGCANTATAIISVGNNPSVTATATPTVVCTGGNSQLLAVGSAPYNNTAAGYSFSASTGTYSAITGTNLGAGAIGDDTGIGNLPIGFTFPYNGTTHTIFGARSNGLIELGQATGALAGFFTNGLATNANMIAPLWDDNNTTGGTVTYATTGIAPNQVLTVQYTGMHVGGIGSGTNPTIDFQIRLHETTGVIEFIYGSTSAALAGTTASIGISGAVGNYLSVTPLLPVGSSTASSTAENTGITSATNFPSGTIYTFTPPVAPILSYAWLPTTFLNDATLSNPLASAVTSSTIYTVTVTTQVGCSVTGTTTVDVSPLSDAGVAAAPSTPICAGQSVTLSSTPIGGGPYTYSWMPGGATTSTVSVSPATTTPYTVTVSNTCGEIVTGIVTVNVNALPTVNVSSSSASYCTPGSPAVVLTASGTSTSYAWLPATGLDFANVASPNATPASTTTYTVTGTDVNGCVNTATIAITALPAVTAVTANASSAIVCVGDTVDLTSSASAVSTILSEGFNDPTNNWTTYNFSTAGPAPLASAWTLRPNGYNTAGGWGQTLNSNDNSQFYLSNADAQGNGGTANTVLLAPQMDVSNYSTLSLSFYHFFRWNTAPDSATIMVSTDGNNFFNHTVYKTATVGTATTFNNAVLNLDTYAGNDTLIIAFAYFSDTWGYGWAIDNVSLTGAMTGLTYDWTSTPAGFTSAVQNPMDVVVNATTTYSVNVTNAVGCSSSASTVVTANVLPVVTLGNDTAVCSAGLPLTLDAGNAGATYAWSTVETTQTISASTAGSYDVAVTDGNGCVGKDTIVVSINATPVVALGTDTIRCGGSVTLYAANAGSTYLWNNASTADTLTATATGQYDVVVTSPAGCEGMDTIMVTINAVPVVNLGADSLVCGTGITLDAANTGDVFAWNTTETTQTISVTNSGLFFVDVTNSFNCTNRDSINITIAAPISVDLGNDSAICANPTIILDAQNNGSTFLWNDATTASTLTVPSAGTYFVTVTSASGCIAQDTIVFTDNSPIVTLSLPFTTTCVNTNTNALSGGAPVGGNYTGTGVFGTNFDASVPGAGNVVISYTYIDGVTGCDATATQTVTVDPCVGIKQVSELASITVSPNPNNGYFSINVPSRDNKITATLYSADGKLLFNDMLTGRDNYNVNIAEYANGIYYLKLSLEGETTVVKVVKQY